MATLPPYPGATRIDPADIRVGDTIEWRRDIDGVRARVNRIDRGGHFWFGPDVFLSPRAKGTFYLIDRPTPQLPTEPGSVITDATIQGIRGLTAILSSTGEWRTAELVDGRYWHHPTEITAWIPAKVVADGEPVTR